MGKRGQPAWNKGFKKDRKCILCAKIFHKKYYTATCSSECKKIYWRNKMQLVYDNQEVKQKISKSMKQQYINGIRNNREIIKKAHQIYMEKKIKQFQENPKIYISKRGYKMIAIPGKGWVKYHHYVWEQVNGKVPEGMVLHHINKDKLDNRIENLRLMTKKDHHKLHYAERIIDTLGRLT